MPRRSGSTTVEYDEEVRCDYCDSREYICGEITEKTLEDDGWYLGPTETKCPECAENDDARDLT